MRRLPKWTCAEIAHEAIERYATRIWDSLGFIDRGDYLEYRPEDYPGYRILATYDDTDSAYLSESDAVRAVNSEETVTLGLYAIDGDGDSIDEEWTILDAHCIDEAVRCLLGRLDESEDES